jgi:peptidoglycan-associated lipoprotein
MNRLFQILMISSLFLACNTAKKAQITPKTATKTPHFVKWDKDFIELNQVKKGEKRTFFYEMTNTTGKDAQVEIVDACDCTTIEFPRGLIHADEKKRFDIEFNSAEKDSSEIIEIRIFWKQKNAAGDPNVDLLKYHYELIK